VFLVEVQNVASRLDDWKGMKDKRFKKKWMKQADNII
jgi:hypothetical protein